MTLLGAASMDALAERLRAAGCVFAEEEAGLLREAAGGDTAFLEALTARRVTGEPLEPLLGWVEFAGARLSVGPGVFVPRQRSVRLARAAVRAVRAAAEMMPDGRGRVRFAGSGEGAAPGRMSAPGAGTRDSGAQGSGTRDSGAPGSGARGCPAPVFVETFCGVAPLASAVARAVPGARVAAVDASEEALVHARLNLAAVANTDRVSAHLGDALRGLPEELRGRVDVVAAVPPYVPDAELEFLPREARHYEPRAALLGGRDGLGPSVELLRQAREWLAPGGALLLEGGARQAGALLREARKLGFAAHTERFSGASTVILHASTPVAPRLS